MKKLGSGGWRHIEERKREQLTVGGYSARTKADAAGTTRLRAPATRTATIGEVAVRAGMFHALGSQEWERVQDLELLGLLDICMGLKIGACGWLCGSRRWAPPPPSNQAVPRGYEWRISHAQRPSLAFARPLLASLEFPRLGRSGRVSDPGKPYRGNLEV